MEDTAMCMYSYAYRKTAASTKSNPVWDNLLSSSREMKTNSNTRVSFNNQFLKLRGSKKVPVNTSGYISKTKKKASHSNNKNWKPLVDSRSIQEGMTACVAHSLL